MTIIIDGKAVAADVRAKVADAVGTLKARHGVRPALAVVLVGEDPASQIYVRNKHKATENAGMRSIEHTLPETASEEEVVALVRKLNEDADVDGILVQLPLPNHISSDRVINEIHPDKDVDGLTEANAGRLLLGKDGLVPCTPQGAIMLIKTVKENLSGLHAVVVGRSILVGKPLSMLLLAENCTVTMAHSRTKDLAAVCREADILCAAVGVSRLIKGDFVKKGAVVIDVGINRLPDGRLVGDVDFEGVSKKASYITPVPGGVGPMTVTMLLVNTVDSAERSVAKRR